MTEPSNIAAVGQKDLVTVVIPAFRARRYLPEALASVRAQTYRAWEIVVVDDCSPEPVDDLVKIFAGTVPKNVVRLIRHPENSGQGAARNTGIRAAAGKFIAFLDHDDWWRETHLADAVQRLESETAGLAYCDFELFEEKPGDQPGTQSADPQQWGSFPDSLYVRNFIQPSGVVMRKRVLEELGLFEPNRKLQSVEDWDLWLRAASRGVKFVRVPKPNLLYRQHSESATANRRLMNGAMADVLCRNLDTLPQVPFALRLQKTRNMCAEAARGYGLENPTKAAYFYALSVRTHPRLNKTWTRHFLAFLFYRTMSLVRTSRQDSHSAKR
jgi:glycosyltransferase involved in cell wall biosynthesis